MNLLFYTKFKRAFSILAYCFAFTCMSLPSAAHDIYFCGEKIPIDDKLVAEKLMNIIKMQMNYMNIATFKQKIDQYMAKVEYYLDATNLPGDFKYLAIVESGFNTDAASGAGAVGFWQLMPATARQLNLTVNETVDERKDFDKSTYAACKVIATNYLTIRKTFGISSWVLAAAAYNVGIGRIKNAITKQGTNYFSMNLNAETAAYVYKIIAVKELFEYPELYMKNFGYNVFNTTPSSKKGKNNNSSETDISGFRTMKVDINEADGQHPEVLKKGSIKKQALTDIPGKVKLVSASVEGKYKHFRDGDPVSLILEADLQVENRFTAKGNIIQGRAWIIGNRVMVDLGYDHRVILYDLKNEKGISRSRLKDKEEVILKVTEELH
jgi:membrane-bound lytic murein transglycosylase D